ncbi:class II aldolase/adducin family protein [Muricomes intestini]
MQGVGSVSLLTLKRKSLFLGANHGAVCVGKTLDDAFSKVAWMEQACEKAYYTLLAAKKQ